MITSYQLVHHGVVIRQQLEFHPRGPGIGILSRITMSVKSRRRMAKHKRITSCEVFYQGLLMRQELAFQR
ncbi:hypothetical protein P7K49_039253 [Saguinus oedipus]|uniref:Uncharacterized protein n=1 Tax=Saguinus oedipus TaxID=9490 RepID=A0ABQ9TGZ2_SAGOE|nr:hypothetical protein P7K49_039253 [Saguinus oedipus]